MQVTRSVPGESRAQHHRRFPQTARRSMSLASLAAKSGFSQPSVKPADLLVCVGYPQIKEAVNFQARKFLAGEGRESKK
ncbi:MAG: hypothetical protein OXT01_25800 [Rhodospirillaceae bacterium]|nr:hypothetical protein [Rhodospirillaceae bacterium]